MGIRLETAWQGKPTVVVDYWSPNRAKTEQLVKATGEDIARAQDLIATAEATITNCVQQLRAAGASWGVVGYMLGTTKAAAHKRFHHLELTSTH